MASPILTQKALDGISSIITTEVLSNLQSFINQVTALSKNSKKVQDIVDTIAHNLDEKTQLSLSNILKRQNNENTLVKERIERNKLPKCGFIKKNGTDCGKACKSGHKKDDRDICDEHFTQLQSYREETCAYPDCEEHVKKTAVPVDIKGEIDGVSYVDKFLCAKHHKKVTSQLQKMNNPCKFMVKSKEEGERMCGALAVSDERCKKHHGKVVKSAPSKKEEEKPAEEPMKKTKGSKKDDKLVEEKKEEPKKAPSKKGSKKTDKTEITVNFKGKRAVNWITKNDDDGDTIYVDINSGLVAMEVDEEHTKVVYGVWNADGNSVAALTDEAEKYAKKHKLGINKPETKSDSESDDE